MILAAYTTEDKAKALPGVAAHPWDGWQFSSDGPVSGVTGRCDMDRIDNPAAFDRACGLYPQPVPQPIDDEGDDMAIVCNSEPGLGDPTKVKFLVTSSGKLRHLGYTEWVARGSDEGVPLTNAQISELGTV